MGSDLPKVLHEVCGRPMVHWVVDAVRAAGVERIVIVVGHQAEAVRSSFGAEGSELDFVIQEPQLGTGHAVLVCRDTLAAFTGDAFVLAGDGPLIRAETLRTLHDHHRTTDALATLATAILDDPTGYGRIVRDDRDRFREIVEDRNASPAQRSIREIYPSYACFRIPELMEGLADLEADATSGEFYLTAIPGTFQTTVDRVEIVTAVPPEDVLSINTPAQLAAVEAVLSQRLSPTAETSP